MFNIFLQFSDSAKFADIARNLVSGMGYGNTFSFWSVSVFNTIKKSLFPAPFSSPLMPYSIALFFKIFGIGDFAVIASSFFYYVLTLVFTYLFGKRLFNSKLVGTLSTLAVGANYDLIHYATNGASESPFIFEIVAGLYFASLKKKWANVVAVFLLFIMYFTRPQAFIYIAGIFLYCLLISFKIRKALVYFMVILLLGLFVDHFALAPIGGRYFLYSVTGRGLSSSFNQSSTASDALRGAAAASSGIVQVIKNVFYNLYNFYKLLPQIINPYLFALFLVGLFKWGPLSLKASEGQVKILRSFKVASIFMVLVTLLVTAASIPFFRYIHPIIPLVYIIAVGTIIEILSYQFSKMSLIVVSTFLILFFGVGQTLGVFLLDSRFEANTHNIGKPPVYAELSYKLRAETNKNDIVLTNLDTWGSWYGERKTVWFPFEPKQIIDPATGKIPFDAIYLTSYLIDDENYYMGADWRLIFNNPLDPKKWTCDGCGEIAKEFKLKEVYKISAGENYENQDASAILLIKK